MYIYTLAPVDSWEGDWLRMDEFVTTRPELGLAAIRFAMEAGAVGAGCSCGWEGDIRGNNLYATSYNRLILTECQELEFRPEIIVAWKQDNNGQTFVASRFPLYGLEKLDGMEGRIFPPLPTQDQDLIAFGTGVRPPGITTRTVRSCTTQKNQ